MKGKESEVRFKVRLGEDDYESESKKNTSPLKVFHTNFCYRTTNINRSISICRIEIYVDWVPGLSTNMRR